MAVFLLIAQYVHFERSYENFIPNRKNIYRISLTAYRNQELISASAENYPARVVAAGPLIAMIAGRPKGSCNRPRWRPRLAPRRL